MRLTGKVRSWNDDRGFGFIEPDAGGRDVFLHVSALEKRNRRPEQGQVLTYTLSADDRGRPRASRVALPGGPLPAAVKSSGAVGAVVAAGVFTTAVALAVIAGKIPQVMLLGYLAVSVLTFIVYALDKSAARKGRWRTQESTLHLLALVGGWPGALVAQQALNHKSRKQSFRSVFRITVVLNLAAFAYMFAPVGSTAMQAWIEEAWSQGKYGQRAQIEWAEPRENKPRAD